MTMPSFFNEFCTLTNYTFGETADGGPSKIAQDAVLGVQCKVLQYE